MSKNIIDLESKREAHQFKQREARAEALQKAFREARGEPAPKSPKPARKRGRKSRKK